MKQKFDIITSTCVPLPLENVDTDQIIPARFLKATDKEGMGDNQRPQDGGGSQPSPSNRHQQGHRT